MAEVKDLLTTALPIGREMVLVRRVLIAAENHKEDVKLKAKRGIRVRILEIVDLDKDGFLAAAPRG